MDILLFLFFTLTFSIPFILGGTILTLRLNQLKKEVKKYILKQAITRIENIQYQSLSSQQSPSLQAARNIFKKHHLWGYLRWTGHISFDYKHCPVEIMEGTIICIDDDKHADDPMDTKTSRMSSSGPVHYLVLKTTFPDTVSGKTIVSNNNLFYKLLPETVVTESSKLNNLFRVKATDQVSARMHLQPNIMSDILDLKRNPHYQNVTYYFSNTELFVFIRTIKPPFNVDIFTSFLTSEQSSQFQKDIDKCLYLFDEMWLNIRARKN